MEGYEEIDYDFETPLCGSIKQQEHKGREQVEKAPKVQQEPSGSARAALDSPSDLR